MFRASCHCAQLFRDEKELQSLQTPVESVVVLSALNRARESKPRGKPVCSMGISGGSDRDLLYGAACAQ